MAGASCWECNHPLAEARGFDDAFCACGAVQPPAHETHFGVLGLAPEYEIDAKALEQRYRTLSKQFHPDKFARADLMAKRYSLLRTTLVNDAYRTLKDPLARAMYLVKLAGVQIDEKSRLAPEFLMTMMEEREALETARERRDHARVQALAEAIREKRRAASETIRSGFRDADLLKVRDALILAKYYDRFLEEVSLYEDSLESIAGVP